jgi:YbbR domain-containing protein
MHDLLFKDFGWKLFSLLLAAFIWYTVQKLIEEPKAAIVSPANEPVQYGEVPVQIMAAAADRHLFQVNSNSVAVTVSGPPAAMNVLQGNQIHASVDLSDFDGKAKNAYRRVDVSVPWGITVVNVEPALLKIVPPAQP